MRILLIVIGILVVIVVAIKIASLIIISKERKVLSEMEHKYPLPKAKQRLLSYGAILALYSDESPRILHIVREREELKEGLASSWEISSRENALETLDWLINEGHRTRYDELYQLFKSGQTADGEEIVKSQKCYESAKSGMKDIIHATDQDFNKILTIAAWDYGRAINIARWSYVLDYISEEEAWDYIEKAAELASETYASWKDYFIAFAFGRAIAYHGGIYQIVYHGKALLEDQESIWKEFSFKL